jgi:hypothetical protein
MKSLAGPVILMFGLFTSFHAIQAQSYTFTTLGGIGRPSGINNAGQIVGYTLGGEQTSGLLYTFHSISAETFLSVS